MPPSIHPSGDVYQWDRDCVSADEAEIVPVTELPILAREHIEAIEGALRGIGWAAPTRVADASRDAALSFPTAANDDRRRNPWRELNEIALQNLDAWVPALGLPHLRKRGNGYECVATWRSSGTGQEERKRKKNLKFHVDGIRDMGTDDGYTPIDVICAWWNWTNAESFVWLQRKLGLDSGEEIKFLFVERQLAEDGTLATSPLPPLHARDSARRQQPAWQPPPIFRVSELAGIPVPPRDFFVENLIPAKKTTLLIGDGGTGKSLLGLMLAVATATGTSWLDLNVQKPGPVLCLAAEDDTDEIHCRLAEILAAEGLTFEGAEDLHVVPLVGEDPVLATANRQTGLMEPTRLFGWLQEKVDQIRPSLLVLDTLADLFGGDEIKREQARSFVGMLNGLAFKFGVTILLLSHPSQYGMESGRGTSGSTGWSNSARGRMYFEQHSSDTDLRVLTLKKTNYGKPGTQYTLRYDEGRFVREQISATAIDLSEAKAEFVRLMEEFARMGRGLSFSPGANYAPKLFSEENEARFSKQRFRDAMNALFREDKLCNVPEGPPSRRRMRLRLAEPDALTIGADESEVDGGE